MAGEYIPFLTYRGAVDPKTISVEIISDDEVETSSSLFENFQKKKTVRKGRVVKRRRVDPVAPTPSHAKSMVVIDSDDDLAIPSNVESVGSDIVDILPTTVQSIPVLSAAMNAISQNKKLRSEIRKPNPQLSEPLDSPAKADNSLSSDSVLFAVYSISTPNPIRFRLLKTDTFEKLSQAFCSCNKYAPDSGALKWYGITLDKKQTPTDFDMNGEERIDFVINTKSHPSSSVLEDSCTPDVVSPNLPPATTSDAIVLKVRHGDGMQKFRIKTTDNMRKLLDGYCTRQQLDPSQVSLHFDGQPLSLTETPTDLDMEDGDLIDVKIS